MPSKGISPWDRSRHHLDISQYRLKDGTMDSCENIKLVIWDLDDTLWAGTLAEGSVELVEDFKRRVLFLNQRGILNSICSNNDFDQAKQQLESYEIWDQFVFASIEFSPKGQQVQGLLTRIGLLAETTLFVDDNAFNRKEVEFYNPGILTQSPAQWLDTQCTHWGKVDATLSRLCTYQQLEKKSVLKTDFEGNNVAFLHASDIKVKLVKFDAVTCSTDRITELLNRSNQLNFTKRRFPYGPAQLIYQLMQGSSHAFVVYVSDKYVDYGLCGFVSISDSMQMDDFCFSCRLLNMGVENAVFQHLLKDFPNIIEWAKNVQQLLEPAEWISVEEVEFVQSDSSTSPPSKKLLTVMGCIGYAIAPFLETDLLVECSSEISASDSIIKQHPNLHESSFDYLLIHAYNEALFPTENIFFRKTTVPIMLNPKVVSSYPSVFEHIEGLIRSRKPFDFFGRSLENLATIRWLWRYTKSALYRSVSRFNVVVVQENIEQLIESLPSHTKVIMLAASENVLTFTEEPWSELNHYAQDRLAIVKQAAINVANTNSRFLLLDPVDITIETNGKHFGHYSHDTYAQLGDTIKHIIRESGVPEMVVN